MGLVYWISCNETNENYIGSTISTLKQRMTQHKSIKQSSGARSIIDRNNYKVIILEDNIHNDILRIREQFYMDCCDNLINKNRAFNKPIFKTIKKIRCECGCMILKVDKQQHILSNRHITLMERIYYLKKFSKCYKSV